MRELFVVNHESTETSLVLRTEEGEEFFLAVNDEARALFTSASPTTDATASTNADADAADTANAAAGEASASPEEAAQEVSAQAESTPLADAPSHLRAVPSAAPEAPAVPVTPVAPVAPVSAMNSVTKPTAPAKSKFLSMRPPEIQNRIRAGATVEELAEEMNVDVARVEPFAHPVLMERARMAEVAKQAHPVREDGPAKLTIFEVLATAFAARGHSLSDAEWDAYRIKGEPWTIRVSWKAGLSINEAEWTLKQSLGSPDTLVARNAVAADLTDPDFVQPVRTLTSVGRGNATRRMEAIDARERDWDEHEDAAAESDLERTAELPLDPFAPTARVERDRDDADSAAGADNADDDVADPAETAAGREASADDEFFQNPDPAPKPSKRRRKAVTPHWEDVLLGVRASTKRPRD